MIDYYEYINSQQWYLLTLPVRQRNNKLCELCNMRYGTCVHHRTYRNLGNEQPEDMLHVCVYCHRLIHHKKGGGYLWPSRLPFLQQLQNEILRELEPGRDLNESTC